MRQGVGSAAFWGFQLLFAGLFAAVFVFVVPSVVEGWLFRGLSVALGGIVGLTTVVGLGFAVWELVTRPEPGTCPHCGQPLPAADRRA